MEYPISIFENIIAETICDDNSFDRKKKHIIHFNPKEIKNILFQFSHKEKNYLIGETKIYYFLAVEQNIPNYSCTEIYLSESLYTLSLSIDCFYEIYPQEKARESFIRALLLDKKLPKKENKKEKVVKI